MKDVELKLIYELIKNSRRSDRELARVGDLSADGSARCFRNVQARTNILNGGKYALLRRVQEIV